MVKNIETWDWIPGKRVGPLNFLMYRSNVRFIFNKLNLPYRDSINYFNYNIVKDRKEDIVNSNDYFNNDLIQCEYTQNNKLFTIYFFKDCKFKIVYKDKQIFPGTVGTIKGLIKNIYLDDDTFHNDSKGLYFGIDSKDYKYFDDPKNLNKTELSFISFSALSLR